MSSNFTLSIELIYLLEWLLKHEESRLRVLIKKALHDGLAQQVAMHSDTDNAAIADELQDVFLEFLSFLETTLLEELESSPPNKQLHQKLGSALCSLNMRNVDRQTTLASFHEAAQELKEEVMTPSHRMNQKIKHTLLGKLLKNWKPAKKDLVN